MNYSGRRAYELETRGHKARGYGHDCKVNRVAAGFMLACFGFVRPSGKAIRERFL